MAEGCKRDLGARESIDECMEQGDLATIKQVNHTQQLHAATSLEAKVNPNAAVDPSTISLVSRKRCRSEEDEQREVEKRGCEEGMSWWTCLMLGVSQENSKPQVVKKVYNQPEN